MRPVCTFTDYFVIATGPQPAADRGDLGRGARPAEARRAARPARVDGTQEGTWILADYLDVVLHVFTPEAREYYKLEELWNDVPAVELDTAGRRLARARPVARQQEIRRRAGQAVHRCVPSVTRPHVDGRCEPTRCGRAGSAAGGRG